MDFELVLANYKRRKFSSSYGNVEGNKEGNAAPHKLQITSLQCTSRVVGVYFLCNEGSVTHYYHFLFAALIPMIEYYLREETIGFRIKTDIGPMKSILCEMPFNIEEISGPREDTSGIVKAYDDKSAYTNLRVGHGEVVLPAYDSFNDQLFRDDTVPKLSALSKTNIVSFIKAHVPFYIFTMPVKRIVLIERKVDPYYNKLNIPNRLEVYNTSGSQRR